MPDASTALFAVMGNPVAHSLSPVMHNAAFRQAGFNGVYVAFRVADIKGAVAAVRALGIRGASITIPHKVGVMSHLDAVDPAGRAMGAVNTIVNDGGRLTGLNTDGPGALRALMEQTAVKGKTIAILGAGGAARAIAFAAAAQGGRILILNRSRDRGEALARAVGAGFHPLEEAAKAEFHILVNATSVGMTPAADAMPVPPEVLCPGMTVMEMVYNPLETRLLSAARQQGCDVVDGVAMFVYQGALQFEAWTGLPAPVDVMRTAVLDALKPSDPRGDR